ncbi:hypothetical protein ACOSQ4_013217 [Xanthoceras sorbifolium]
MQIRKTYQLDTININFEDEIQALLILGQMLESWKCIVQLISGSFRKVKLKFQEVVDMIMTEEIRRHEDGFGSESSALDMESKGRNRYRGNQIGKSKQGFARSGDRRILTIPVDVRETSSVRIMTLKVMAHMAQLPTFNALNIEFVMPLKLV